ncbi:MAG: hypothetical protein D6772_05385, partial [Bacteroidetes bacterium]
LFKAAAQLPDRFLIRGGAGKYLLRELMSPHLPEEVFTHPKQGFAIPLFRYQNEAFRALAHDLLLEDNPWPGFFPNDFLRQTLQCGLELKKNTVRMSVFQASHQLWMLMQLLGWARRFGVSL